MEAREDLELSFFLGPQRHWQERWHIRLSPESQSNQGTTEKPNPLSATAQCDCDCDCACETDGNFPMPALSSPVFVFLELTPACNNQCHGCGNVFANERARPPLDAAGWETILAELHPSVFRIRLTGGEPTLHPEFAAIVQAADRLQIPFALFTNARWPDPPTLFNLLKYSPYFTGFLISLHGATSQAHDAFTGVAGSFEETVANIRWATATGLSVTTSTILTGYSVYQVPRVIELSQELGANHAVFNRYLGRADDVLEPEPEALKQAVEAVEQARRDGARVRLSVCIPQCFHPSSSTGCLAGIAFCTVDPWGNVRPCNHAPFICGNLLEQSIEEIWNSEEMQRWRKMIPKQCYSCSEFGACHGGCRALAMLLERDKDHLIGKPVLAKPQEPPEELVLYEGTRPFGRFAMRPEPFGYVLVHGNRLIPASHDSKAVLDVLDGQTTLREIEKRFGQQALSFVGSLYRQGLVELMRG